MAYLTYIIDNYKTLPLILVFIHSHRFSPKPIQHNDARDYDTVTSIKSLQLPYVLSSGYVNLRCVHDPGCSPVHRQKHEHVTAQAWEELFGPSAAAFPAEIGVACCAQFAVSRKQVLLRPKDQYVKFRRWLVDTELDDEKSGRVFEYLWHIIFGMESV